MLANAALAPQLIALGGEPGHLSGLILATQLPRQCACTPAETSGNGSDAGAVAEFDLQHGSFLAAQMTLLLDSLREFGMLHLEVVSE